MDKPHQAANLTISRLFTTDRGPANRRVSPDQQSGGKKGQRARGHRERNESTEAQRVRWTPKTQACPPNPVLSPGSRRHQ